MTNLLLFLQNIIVFVMGSERKKPTLIEMSDFQVENKGKITYYWMPRML